MPDPEWNCRRGHLTDLNVSKERTRQETFGIAGSQPKPAADQNGFTVEYSRSAKTIFPWSLLEMATAAGVEIPFACHQGPNWCRVSDKSDSGRSAVILTAMQRDPAVIDRWSGAAPFWEKHRETIRQMFEPVTKALIDDARIDKGNSVLDVATGPGEPALGIASVVGPEGRIVGIDPIPEMVAAARRSAERSRFRNVQFEVAFADDLPFAADSFDAVVSRFGIMFAPSPGDAVREMLRVLKPERKLALAVWHLAESNPFFHALSQVLERYVDSPPPEPDAPDAFRFAASGKLRKILGDAGAIASSERLLRFSIEAHLSAEEFWVLRSEMSEKLRQKVTMLAPEQLSEAKREALEAMGDYSTTRGMSFPGEVLIVSGTKSRPA